MRRTDRQRWLVRGGEVREGHYVYAGVGGAFGAGAGVVVQGGVHCAGLLVGDGDGLVVEVVEVSFEGAGSVEDDVEGFVGVAQRIAHHLAGSDDLALVGAAVKLCLDKVLECQRPESASEV